MPTQNALAGAALAAVVLTIPSLSHAQSLEIAPINVEFAPGEMATTLTVTNHDAKSTVIQVRAFAWDQQGGVDHLTPTDDLMVSPPITEVVPGVAQVIRLVMRRPAGVVEQCYRLLLDQIPPPAAAGVVHVALRMSIPVFVGADARVSPSLAWRVEASGSGQLSLVVANSGGQHAKVMNPTLTSAGGPALSIEPNVNPYVLPGAMRQWRIAGHAAPGSVVRLSAKANADRVDRTINIVGAP